jgi:ribosome-associated protein
MATLITIENDLITLGQFLKFSKIINNGGEARHFLLNNAVLVNKMAEQRRGKKLRKGDVVEINTQEFIVVTKGE